ncbi:MAG: hypothetical protein HWN67_10205 [Candidatus Helarchaeota archaeon]|nr:hypothetical protein [Candidatus Helarchaeota archaeon]
MPKAKKPKAKTKKIKAKQVTKGKKSRFVDEIIFQGVISENFKVEIPDIQQIIISSQDFKMDIELPISLIESIEENYNYVLEEKREIFIKMSRDKIKQDFAIFLGKCIIFDVRQKYFLGSIGGLTIKLMNLSENIKLFPQNAKINVALFKSLEDLQK